MLIAQELRNGGVSITQDDVYLGRISEDVWIEGDAEQALEDLGAYQERVTCKF